MIEVIATVTVAVAVAIEVIVSMCYIRVTRKLLLYFTE